VTEVECEFVLGKPVASGNVRVRCARTGSIAGTGRLKEEMIPQFTGGDVEAAVRHIDQNGVDKRRASTMFCFVMGGRHYPPKYVVSLAVANAHGTALAAQEFSGGTDTNAVLAGLGFEVVACRCGGISEAGAAKLQVGTPVRGRRQRDSQAIPSGATTPIGRVVVNGETTDDPAVAEAMLLEVLNERWPKDRHVRFLTTPGGFIRSGWPRGWSGLTAWESRPKDVASLIPAAERVLNRVVTKRVRVAAKGKADVLTIGVDLSADPEPEQAEFVAVVDVRAGTLVRWTGKSYPTSGQEQTLVQVADLDTHLLQIAGERVLVLGCHDLNMFSPRGRANQTPQGLRRKRCDEMVAKVRRFRPTVVLQHPHTTDTPNIWRMPWLSLQAAFPSVKSWASAIGYHNWNGRPRAPLERVLRLTQSGEDCVDIPIRASDVE